MLCPRCGFLIEQEDAIFCLHCGAQMPESEAGRPGEDIDGRPA